MTDKILIEQRVAVTSLTLSRPDKPIAPDSECTD